MGKPREWPWNSFPEDSSTWDSCVQEYDALKEDLEFHKRVYVALVKRDKKLKAKLVVAKKALEYYADYFEDDGRGDMARKVIKQIGEG